MQTAAHALTQQFLAWVAEAERSYADAEAWRLSCPHLSIWEDAIAGFRTDDEDLAHAVELINRHGCVAATRERARHYAQRAIDAIAGFPACEARSAMAEAAEFAVSRRY